MFGLLTLTVAVSLLQPSAPPDACRFEAEHSAAVNAAGASMLRLLARAGSLVVEGRPGLAEVRVRGQACASDRELLDGIRLIADRSGGAVRIEAEIPEMNGLWGDTYARLNLTIEVPAGLAADIRDSSGEMEVRGLGALTVDDGSGEMTLEDITGPVTIEDGSGEIRLARIGGDVEIDDNSGRIEVRGVRGSVTLEDGSGSIDVADVTGSVRVVRDGSGSIRVADVRGDFTIERDGSGGVRYSNVGGAVRIAGK